MVLNQMFCDGMVLQAGKPIRIFGEGGGIAEVDFCGQTVKKEFITTKWVLELKPVNYGGPFELKVTLDTKTQVLKDVYVGDVYLIAGQSNMQMKLSEMCQPELHKFVSHLRLFSTTRVQGGERFTPNDGWVEATNKNVSEFSALGYLFGKEMYDKTGHMIGLVSLYQGAAAIQCFLPKVVFEENSKFNIPFEQRYDIDRMWNQLPSVLFDFSLCKISPFSFSAVVWYQGESNCSSAESKVYHDMLLCLIKSWRAELKDTKLPFVVVQIHNFKYADNDWWHLIQKAQLDVSKEIPNVETVITADVCETDDIHPKNKLPVALRICEVLSKYL